MAQLSGVTVLIPAYKPETVLKDYVLELREKGFSDFVIVDDGGGERYAPVFASLRQIPGVTVLTHEVNRGKGEALKTGFTWYEENRKSSKGIVTADADGQHLASDVVKTAIEMLETGEIVLGSRDFTDPSVPKRSLSGNLISTFLMKRFYGETIPDTQTGLRAIPKRYAGDMCDVPGSRYDYEMNMLYMMARERIPCGAVGIETVYLNDNKSSHFKPFLDSMRIYRSLLTFLLISVLCGVADLVLTSVLLGPATGRLSALGLSGMSPPMIYVLTACAVRVLTGLANYFLNYFLVFRKEGGPASFIRYLLLAVAVAAVHLLPVVVLGIFLSNFGPGLAALVRILTAVIIFPLVFRTEHNAVFRYYKKRKGDRKK